MIGTFRFWARVLFEFARVRVARGLLAGFLALFLDTSPRRVCLSCGGDGYRRRGCPCGQWPQCGREGDFCDVFCDRCDGKGTHS